MQDLNNLLKANKEGKIDLSNKEIEIIEKFKNGDTSVEQYKSILKPTIVAPDYDTAKITRSKKYTYELFKEIIPVPTASIANVFSKHVGKWYAKIQQNRYQLRLLTEARDRLLPKLMSGEITV